MIEVTLFACDMWSYELEKRKKVVPSSSLAAEDPNAAAVLIFYKRAVVKHLDFEFTVTGVAELQVSSDQGAENQIVHLHSNAK